METFLGTFSMYSISESIQLKLFISFFFLPSMEVFIYYNFPMHLGASYLKKSHSEAFAN